VGNVVHRLDDPLTRLLWATDRHERERDRSRETDRHHSTSRPPDGAVVPMLVAGVGG